MKRALPIATAPAAAVVAAAPATAAAARVTTMVVGKERVLRDATDARLVSKRRVKVGRRRCTVAGATPLAALAGLKLTLRIRDYGSCGRRARDAGSLFVTRVGPDRNRGVNGWVYKLDRRAGSAGAADPSGAFGTGRRLRDGDRLLWFWCDLQLSGSCQRTLEAVPDRTVATPGETVSVTVRGYDDRGRGVKVAGASVRLGSASAVTDADGVATLVVADSGRLPLVATAAGMVRSFPGQVRAG
jgi:hypothetical protein